MQDSLILTISLETSLIVGKTESNIIKNNHLEAIMNHGKQAKTSSYLVGIDCNASHLINTNPLENFSEIEFRVETLRMFNEITEKLQLTANKIEEDISRNERGKKQKCQLKKLLVSFMKKKKKNNTRAPGEDITSKVTATEDRINELEEEVQKTLDNNKR